jgi:ribosomal protein L4
LNIKKKRLALSTALYYSLNKVTVVDNVFNSITVPKTKNIATLLNKFIPESQDKKSLVITHESNRHLTLSIRNLPNVQLLYSNTLSIRDLLSAKHVIITEEALKHLTETI